jgi:hypothetical protein
VRLITLIVEFAVADISMIAWNLSLFDRLAILHVGFANRTCNRRIGSTRYGQVKTRACNPNM